MATGSGKTGYLIAALLTLAACGGNSRDPAQGSTGGTLEDYAGDWTGTLAVGGIELPPVLHVAAGAARPVTLDSPEQGTFGLAADGAAAEAVREGTLKASWSSIGASYTGRLSAGTDTIGGEFDQGGKTFTLDLVRASEADLAPRARAQDPVPPLPYAEEAVHVDVPGTSVVLAGTLTLPAGAGPFPGVVLLSGSGPHDRDETMVGHRPFRVSGDRLARAGIAVFRYDDRGIGESTGTFAGATSRDFAADAAAALAFLASRPEIGRVGFVGHSEGGLVAPLAIAENDAAADFVVALAGPFVPMRDIIARQVEDALRLAGTDDAVVANSLRVQNRLLDAALVDGDEETVCRAIDEAAERLPESRRQEAKTFCGPWFRTVLRLDPTALHRATNVPTLTLFGALDRQVAADPNAEAARALPDAEVRVVDGANHLFQTATTGALAEYRAIEKTRREDVMASVAEWVTARRATCACPLVAPVRPAERVARDVPLTARAGSHRQPPATVLFPRFDVRPRRARPAFGRCAFRTPGREPGARRRLADQGASTARRRRVDGTVMRIEPGDPEGFGG